MRWVPSSFVWWTKTHRRNLRNGSRSSPSSSNSCDSDGFMRGRISASQYCSHLNMTLGNSCTMRSSGRRMQHNHIHLRSTAAGTATLFLRTESQCLPPTLDNRNNVRVNIILGFCQLRFPCQRRLQRICSTTPMYKVQRPTSHHIRIERIRENAATDGLMLFPIKCCAPAGRGVQPSYRWTALLEHEIPK